jgi:type IV pilus assembly protein PilM
MNARAQQTLKALGKLLTPAERRVAVDVGSRHVKIAEFRHRKEKLEVVYLDSMAIPYNSSRGDITPERVSETLLKLLQKHNIRSGGFVSLLPREFVTIKQFELPSAQHEQLKQMLQFEAEKYLPFAVDRAIVDFDYEVLESGEEPEEESPDELEPQTEQQKAAQETVEAMARAGQKSLVTMAGVRRAVIPKFLVLLTVKGCRQRAIDVSSFALYNAFRYYCSKHPVDPEGGDQVIIEIGARRTECVLVSAETGRLVFTRSLNRAGDILTEYIAGQEDISFEEAEQLKCEQWDNTVLANSEAFDVAFQPLLVEIEKTLRYMQKSSLSLNIGTVWLSGGSANVPNLCGYLQEKLGIPVQLFNPVDMLGVQAEGAPASSFSMAVGCGLRLVHETGLKVDLLPVDITKLQVQALRKRRLMQLGAAAAVVVAVLMTILGLRVLKSTHNLTTLQRRIEEIQPRTRQLAAFEKRNEQLRLIVSEMEELTDRKTAWTKVMQTIAECMTSNVWVRKLRVQKNNRLDLEISSLGVEYLDFVNELKKRIRFENVRADSSTTFKRYGKEVQDVRITCTVLPDFKFYEKLRSMVPAGLVRSKPEEAGAGTRTVTGAATNTGETAAGETGIGTSTVVTEPAVSNAAGTDSASPGGSAGDEE